MEKRQKLQNTLACDLATIERAGLAELQRMHRQLFGREHPAGNVGHLRRKLAWHVQARGEGGLPESLRQRAIAIARNASVRTRGLGPPRRTGDAETVLPGFIPPDSRIPLPGCLIVKTYRGRTLVVRVLDHGFEYEDARFESLSAVARHITGTKWNGLAFFGLTKRGAHARQ